MIASAIPTIAQPDGVFKSVIASSPHLGTIEMFQQQYTGVIQRDKTEGRATDSLAIVLWRSTIAAVELRPVRPWPGDFRVEYGFRDRKHLVFALGTIL